MRRNVVLVTLLLAALNVLAGWRLYSGYQEQVRRRSVFLNTPAPALPPPLLMIPNPPEQVSAIKYAKVATELPFSKDRNPTVVIEAPPPKPVPVLPRYYGALNFGNGLQVILAEAPGKPQKRYRIGDQVGDFKLVAATSTGLEFEWDGKRIPAPWDEMRDKASNPPEVKSASAPSSQQPAVVQSSGVVETVSSRSGETVSSVVSSSSGRPGADIGANFRGCAPGDNSPPGTVADGYRKIVSETPFGKSCRWERVN